MTQAKAIEQMRKHSRHIIEPRLAQKIAKAYGFTLNDLGIKPAMVKDFGLQHAPETAELTAVDTSFLAQAIAYQKTGTLVKSDKLGHGSYADDITNQACTLLESL